MKGSCYRQIQTMRSIPVWPARISISNLSEKLKAQGIEIHIRSLQRDLNSLSKLFDIENDGSKDIPGWYWKKDASKLELPEMEPSVALSFKLIRQFLDKFMPQTTMHELSPYFQHSSKILNTLQDNHLTDWSSKVALISRNQPLLSPEINPVALAEIYDALLFGTQLNASYKPRNEEQREYTINPLGIVVVDQIIYLVGTLWEYKDIKQFALHRFESAKATDNKGNIPDGFNLNTYIKEGSFEFVLPEEKTIKLKLKINKGIAKHLSESKISDNQKINYAGDEIILSAETKNTQQLRWWLLSFGDGVEVVEPASLRAEFEVISDGLYNLYKK